MSHSPRPIITRDKLLSNLNTGIKITICFIALMLISGIAYCQSPKSNFTLTVVNEKAQPADGATVALLKDTKQVKAVITDAKGIAAIENIPQGTYTFSVTYTGYKQQVTGSYHFPSDTNTVTITLQPTPTVLKEVNITSNKPYIEQKQGKVILNVDASPSNVGTTVLEVLEKSPGVTVDRNGGISLQGKPGVLVTIDDKPTYVSGADLENLLSSMSSSQVDQIELIANPSAKYDASGNAGVINIKTKKNKLKGFNGVFTASVGQGVYPKNNENLALNYRSGKVNVFFNYNLNLAQYLTKLYALRSYFDANGVLTAMLQQPAYFKGVLVNNTLKTGIDYDIDAKTTVGIVLGGIATLRDGDNNSLANWLSPKGVLDSAISTENKSVTQFTNGSINVNAKHTISDAQDIALNFDILHYNINNEQDFTNQLLAPGGYTQVSTGVIPTTINITSGKVDYTFHPAKGGTLQAGVKSSHSATDNTAMYQNLIGGQFVDDNTKNNRFIYNENISAVYGNIEEKYKRLTITAGLRYEYTGYNANQLGNATQKDSAFSRYYGGLFPSGYISYQADTANTFSFSAGRRIDRPVFQTLNPFYFIINKYTYSTGNPFLFPQYSWNLVLSHQYKNLLTTSVSYSDISNYFSQLFLNDATKGILLYTQGNVGHTYNLGVSSTVVASPFRWWSFTAQANFNHKKLAGFNGNNYTTTINQLSINTSNQFTVAKVYTLEMIGTYTTRARNDIQELLYPTGQLSLGISKPILKKKATLKFSARDIFYTNWMEGLTQFPNATEYFKLQRDTRVYTIAFTYRFGKAYKTIKHTNSASDETDRVGNG
jgi:iron complex outermembrane receptor protein